MAREAVGEMPSDETTSPISTASTGSAEQPMSSLVLDRREPRMGAGIGVRVAIALLVAAPVV